MLKREQHRMTDTGEWHSYHNMKRRCNTLSNNRYEFYGARGIKVCARWAASFTAFLEDMGLRPTPKHSLDRIDTDKDYTPQNCRWATDTEQARNKNLYAKNRTGMAGVRWSNQAGKYTADIRVNGKLKYLGCFDDLFLAFCARKSGEVKFWC